MDPLPFAAAMTRRRMIGGSMVAGVGLSGLAGCAAVPGGIASASGLAGIAPLRASPDRVFDITVCLRPFRAAGPRLDTEQLGGKLIVHNYGHGGSGWSLSWGSGTIAVEKAMASSPKEIAVIGCGALGLTAATLAQRAGAKVTIYARDMLPQTRSSRATGSWTPDSRIALAEAAGPGFGALWEQMARTSFKLYRQYLGLPGNPIEWTDRYTVTDQAMEFPRRAGSAGGMMEFGHYNDLVRDLTPKQELMPAGTTPFDAPFVYRTTSLQFNVADYGHTLMTDFLLAGGKFQRMEFHTPADLAQLKESVIINCPGYGARSLWKDESVVPVRGQIAWLIPQREFDYGLLFRGINVVPRTDGIAVQAVAGGDMRGYGEDSLEPDRAEAEAVVASLAELYAHFAQPPDRV